ncbi:MAG: oligopeptide/dipeptide ABC transporter ATP-binding protein [Chloroflexota bacterium]
MTATPLPAVSEAPAGAPAPAAAEPLVRITGLVKTFPAHVPGRGTVTIRALDGVDLAIAPGEAYGLVGESGSGKTTLARCLLRLTDPTAGRIELEGRDITTLAGAELRRLRREMQVVFQDPVGSLDPRARVRDVVAEPLRTHEGLRGRAAEARVIELLDEVGLGRQHLDRRAHELSGGQCQRVAIARAIALRPRLLVLDEPTSALDVSVQAQILNLLVQLRAELGLTYLLISHDLGVVRYLCDRIGVLYLGRMVEEGPAHHALEAPSHPYTRALLSARPSVDADVQPMLMRGDPPSLTAPPPGCTFHPRCWLRERLGDPARCVAEVPLRRPVAPGVTAACHLIDPDPALDPVLPPPPKETP